KPGPPVVSISTVRPTPSAFGLLQAARAGWVGAAAARAGAAAGAAAAAGAGAAAGAAFGAGACDHATEGAHSGTATNNPAATRIAIFPNCLMPACGRAANDRAIVPPNRILA